MKRIIKIPVCKKCEALQIKLENPKYEKCKYCNSELEEKNFVEE